MSQFASQTSVPVEKTRMEIEATLRRYKATAFGYGTEGSRAMVRFRIAERWIQFILTLPDREDKDFTEYKQGSTTFRRVESEIDKRYEQACRQKWRALLLVIKAKLEGVASGIVTLEDEFLAQTMLPDGSTVGQWAKPQIDDVYRLGHMPPNLLIGGPSSSEG